MLGFADGIVWVKRGINIGGSTQPTTCLFSSLAVTPSKLKVLLSKSPLNLKVPLFKGDARGINNVTHQQGRIAYAQGDRTMASFCHHCVILKEIDK
ncbi:MAG: hypothetical protein F6K41_31770 [Symploca sp. SIO3E6]|nr:hypothetical protein [Caldora sp. SIO3E6]